MSELSEFDIMWNNCITQMISAINSDNNMRDYFMDFRPDKDNGDGYAHYQDPKYRYYTGILELKTITMNHSGASFTTCLRESINQIQNMKTVYATEITEEDSSITKFEIKE
tara:strand:- start:31 stop:363 length:333 start_codon:yes stop_codon:yes gene_type:complete